jgi:hypothetical protein
MQRGLFRMCESEKNKKGVEPALEPLLQAHIGKQLREMYGAMTREPVPDRFRLLLEQLEAGERAPPDNGGESPDSTSSLDDEAGAR